MNHAPSGDTPSSQGEPQNPGSQDGNTLPMRGDTHAPPPRSSGAAQGSSATSDKSGDRVGNYTLLEKIGSGGFGVVWRAERREPFVQQVAIKLLRPGMDSESVLARFEQERQSLALMDHPNIAKVIDGGITEGGRNYFVMELVKGEPITKFCDRHRLPIERRLELFAQACDAIQHAHMKGIIHRDLKPGNILAAMGEADGAEGFSARVKIIDFGVAKATARALTERQLFTELGQMIGTPEYMSPEQADGGMDVDTRTDIYALGVVLYELLVGATPFDAKSLRSAGLAAIHRIIRDSEPPKPSDRLRAMTAAAASPDTPSAVTVAQERGTKSQTLMTRLREELEWLPMKAMRKERGERYRSAAEFADDIRNYLGGKPLLAGPESAAYRTRKFVRRHRAAVLSGALMAGVVVAAAVISTIFWLGEAKQRRLAEERERQVRAVSEFQQDMLEQAKPEVVGPKLSPLILSRVKAALADATRDRSAADARIDAATAALERVNSADLARDLLEVAILDRASVTADARFGRSADAGGDPATLADLKQVLAIVQYAISKPDLALPLQQAALEARERLREESDRPADRRKLAQSLVWFGRILDAQPDATEAGRKAALQAIERGCDLYAQNATPLDLDGLAAQEMLAEALARRNRSTEANQILKAVLAACEEALRNSGASPDPSSRDSIKQRWQTCSLGLGDGLRTVDEPEAALQVLQPAWDAVNANDSVSILVQFKLLNNLALARIDAASKIPDQSRATAQRERGLEELADAAKRASVFGEESDQFRLAHATLAQALWQIKPRESIDEILRITPTPEVADSEAGARALIWRAHALRERADPSGSLKCITKATEIVDQQPPDLTWCSKVIRQIAEYHEQAAAYPESIPFRKRLVKRWSSAMGTQELIELLNDSIDLAYAQAWSGSTETACSTLRQALDHAGDPMQPDGLSPISDARWDATNLLSHLKRDLSDKSDPTVDRMIDDLRTAREKHNRMDRSALGKPLETTWHPRSKPAVQQP